MASTDPIADFLTQIRNAHMARHDSIEAPFSKSKEAIARILQAEGFVAAYKVNEKKPFNTISVVLKYVENREPAIRKVRRISRPGRRVYVSRDEIPQVLGGLGINILSTSRGILTGKKARQEGIGGELICEVY